MKKIAPLLLRLLEPLLILATVVSWILTSKLINPMPIGIIILFCILTFTKIKLLGQFLALLMVVVSLYFMLAVYSEYLEFPTGTPAAYRLLAFGLAFFGITLCLATVMTWKYFK